MIRFLHEPRRLLLAWQSSREGSSRRRWDIGELSRDSVDQEAPVTLRYFDEQKLAGAFGEGFDGYPGFKLGSAPFHDTLESFMRRLPPRRRADFPQYLEKLRVAPEAQFTDFALLGASEARLPSDGFSVVNPMDDIAGPFQFVTEAVGFRHLDERPSPQVGDTIELSLDQSNPHDPNAISFMYGDKASGWVNRLQTAAFRRWMEEGRVSVSVDRLNGTPDYPRLYLFVSVGN